MAALVREAGLAVVRELMSRSSHKSSSSVDKSSVRGSSSSSGSSYLESTGPGSRSEHPQGGVEGDNPKSHSSVAADVVSVVDEVAEVVCICSRHFESALQRVRPSVALQERKR